jgi:hypothetical protein
VLGFGNALIAPLSGLAARELGFPDGAIVLALCAVLAGGVAHVVLLRREQVLPDREAMPGVESA